MRLLVAALAACFAMPATAHDHNRQNLNQWYESLERPDRKGGKAWGYSNSISCCQMNDCHETEAEFRGSDVWARLGYQENGEWHLVNWMKIPPEKIIRQKYNPTGNPVVCHTMSWKKNSYEMETGPGGVEIYCFIDASQI